MGAVVEVVDPAGGERVSGPVAALVETVLRSEGLSGSAVVAFVDEHAITRLNARYRGLDEPTDVLSFRYADATQRAAEDGETFEAAPGEGGPALGELAICPAVVCRYAAEEGREPGEALGWTLVHGALHLAGYDHETDRGQMRAREQELLRVLAPLVVELEVAPRPGEAERRP